MQTILDTELNTDLTRNPLPIHVKKTQPYGSDMDGLSYGPRRKGKQKGRNRGAIWCRKFRDKCLYTQRGRWVVEVCSPLWHNAQFAFEVMGHLRPSDWVLVGRSNIQDNWWKPIDWTWWCWSPKEDPRRWYNQPRSFSQRLRVSYTQGYFIRS